MHRQCLGDAGRALALFRRLQPDAVRRDRPGPSPLGPEAGRERPEARLPDQVEHVPQAVRLHDPAALHPMHLAVAQEDRPPGRRDRQPVRAERAAIMADRRDVDRALVAAGDEDLVAPLEVGHRPQQRRPGAAPRSPRRPAPRRSDASRAIRRRAHRARPVAAARPPGGASASARSRSRSPRRSIVSGRVMGPFGRPSAGSRKNSCKRIQQLLASSSTRLPGGSAEIRAARAAGTGRHRPPRGLRDGCRVLPQRGTA